MPFGTDFSIIIVVLSNEYVLYYHLFNSLRYQGKEHHQHKKRKRCFFVTADIESQIKDTLESMYSEF